MLKYEEFQIYNHKSDISNAMLCHSGMSKRESSDFNAVEGIKAVEGRAFRV